MSWYYSDIYFSNVINSKWSYFFIISAVNLFTELYSITFLMLVYVIYHRLLFSQTTRILKLIHGQKTSENTSYICVLSYWIHDLVPEQQ